MGKGVYGIESLKAFIDSPTCEMIMGFLEQLVDACKGCENNQLESQSVADKALCDALDSVKKLAEETELEGQSARFGNKAFRTFSASVSEQASDVLQNMCDRINVTIPAQHLSDLVEYWIRSFGEPSRLDYGTGHEATFLFFLLAARNAQLFGPDVRGLALVVFPKYLELVRYIQLRYKLEPAGSHGVWSLDDYQFIPFILGSSQLDRPTSAENYVPPSHLAQDAISSNSRSDMFSDSIRHIHRTKTGSLSEHSPILNDVLHLNSWQIVNEGLLRLFKAEVLGKHPVAQHFVFGQLISITWSISDKDSAAQPNPFAMARLQQSVVPGINPDATDIVSKYFAVQGRLATAFPPGATPAGTASSLPYGAAAVPQASVPGIQPGSVTPGSIGDGQETVTVDHRLHSGGDGIDIKGWSITSSISRIASDDELNELSAANEWLTFPTPEQFFNSNSLKISHESGLEIKFDPVAAIKGCLIPTDPVSGEHVPDRHLFKVVHAPKWAERTDVNGTEIKEWRTDFDWTYTTVYTGTLSRNGEAVQLQDADEGIDYHRLKVREPILWFKEVILFEDDLTDSGVSKCSVKVRVMPSGWFVLCRCWVRADDTFVRIYDARYCHFFDSEPSKVTVEISKQEASFAQLKEMKKPCVNVVLKDPNMVSQFLPQISKTVQSIVL